MKVSVRFFVTVALPALVLSFPAFAQTTAVGEWAAYQSFTDATKVESYGNLTYCLSNGNLYSFDTDDNSLETYNKVNLLYDTKISTIAYSADYQTLVIAYESGNIDLLIRASRTVNIADLANTSSVTDKTINSIYINSSTAYLAGNFGICLLNIEKHEISNTYMFDYTVRDVALLNDTLYAATDNGVYAGSTSRNLIDGSNWELADASLFTKLAVTGDGRLYGINTEGLYLRDSSGQFTRVLSDEMTYVRSVGNTVICGRTSVAYIISEDGSRTSVTPNVSLYDIDYNTRTGTYWCACGSGLMNAYKLENGSFTAQYTSLAPDGPRHELFYFMKFFDTDLYIAGGMLNYPDVFNPGTVMRYSGGMWSYLDEDISSKTGTHYYNTTSVAIDPRDPTHIFATSSFGGLYEFKDDNFVELYTYYADPDMVNSTLTSVLPNEPEPRWYVRTDGLNYDSDNNLWMVNSSSQTIINVMKADGTWTAFNHTDIAGAPTVDRMIIDSAGRIWITLRRTQTGLFCFDYNGTVDDTSDDQTKYISSFVNQDGETLGELAVYSVAEDRDGAIWVGTTSGPLVISNPSSIFGSGTPQLTQIKVPRNDGTNLADYLLSNETVTAIAVDGANRKWIGTQNTGVYLLSSDGIDMIEHFNTDNSPLFSNYIQSLALNPKTGELFIGTDAGLLSYRTDSSEPADEFSRDAVYAFPNPVEPGYQGMITVTGLVYDTDIKITNTAGRVIASGTSLGGSFAWDGKDAYGREVATGIYFVVASDPDGKTGIVTKIAIIR